jgi:hypothetical protein
VLTLKELIHADGRGFREKRLQILLAPQCDRRTHKVIDRGLAFGFHTTPGAIGYACSICGLGLSPTET